MNEEEIKKYEDMLSSNEFILFKPDKIIEENEIKYRTPVAIFVILSIIMSLSNNESFKGLGFVCSTIAIILFFITNSKKNENNKKISSLNRNIAEHNLTVFENFVREKLQENNLDKTSVDKEIVLIDDSYHIEKILINDSKKTFNIVEFSIFPRKSFVLKNFNYFQMIKYDLIDNSTQTQIATSTISSNAGKAIGGAVASQLLIGNSATGAVIGSSGSRTMSTTYNTTMHSSYTINIYLNQLQNSIIHINSSNRKTIDDIISVLEYINNSEKTI